jgi:hypothetical protein
MWTAVENVAVNIKNAKIIFRRIDISDILPCAKLHAIGLFSEFFGNYLEKLQDSYANRYFVHLKLILHGGEIIFLIL